MNGDSEKLKLPRWVVALVLCGAAVVFLALCILVGRCQAADPVAAWDASLGATGYTLYYHDGIDEYRVGTTEMRIPLSVLDLVPCREYRITVTAYNDAGESGRSNEVTWKSPCYVPHGDLKPIKITIPSGVTVTITAE